MKKGETSHSSIELISKTSFDNQWKGFAGADSMMAGFSSQKSSLALGRTLFLFFELNKGGETWKI